MRSRYLPFKACFDICMSLLLLTLFLAFLLIIAFLIRCQLGAPVLFSHQRPGFRGRPFCLLKVSYYD